MTNHIRKSKMKSWNTAVVMWWISKTKVQCCPTLWPAKPAWKATPQILARPSHLPMVRSSRFSPPSDATACAGYPERPWTVAWSLSKNLGIPGSILELYLGLSQNRVPRIHWFIIMFPIKLPILEVDPILDPILRQTHLTVHLVLSGASRLSPQLGSESTIGVTTNLW